MSVTPKPRFEVPPEYAEVYERAYRRAYEQGQVQLRGSGSEAPAAPPARGRRVAIPEQRSGPRRRASRSDVRRRERRDHQEAERRATTPVVLAQRRASTHVDRRGHRAHPRHGSTLLPLLGLLGLITLLVAGAFILGRATAGTGVAPATAPTGAAPGAESSAAQGTAAATEASGTSSGTGSPVPVVSASTDCTALAGTDANGRPVGYQVGNVLDADPDTAWRCDGLAEGQELTFRLAPGSTVTRVGLVPGYAYSDASTGTDEYARHNRITKVAWSFDDGRTLVQDIEDDPLDRSLRSIAVPKVAAATVTLRILGVAAGADDATMISTVVIAGG